MNIAIVFGTRPEAVKLSKVVAALRAAGESPTVYCTNQHTDLLRGTPAEDSMKPDVNLGLASSNDPLAYASLCEGALRAKWARDKPDLVIVQGDTASAYAGALAAWGRYPVAHIEAGIRSHDEKDPWPEETFRREIDNIASQHNGWKFAPTENAKCNLLDWWHTETTGNPGIDALYSHTQPLQHPQKMQDRVLVTLHRRESFGEPLTAMVRGLFSAAARYPSLEFLWPLHPNPKVQDAARLAGGIRGSSDSDVNCLGAPPNLVLTSPIPTVAFARMLAASRCVISDSGGVQEEAAALGVPCLVAREKTDRPESVELGLAKVVGRTPEGLLQGLDWALGFQARCTPSDCFGDGAAAPRIVEHLLNGMP